ncbi:MAG: ATP-binding response regulator [Roseateles sp.]|uniref:ATP-binding response regulator n=1 Tax=Roseateles sp. TaxID=1971397 RepID=UPI0040374168
MTHLTLERKLDIVCIEDEPDDVELIRLALERGGVDARVRQVDDEAGLRHCLQVPPDLLLCDYSIPGFSAERALSVLSALPEPVPLVVVTRAIGEAAVVELFRAGAKDYVAKDKLALLPAVIERVLRLRAAERQRQRDAKALADANTRLRLLSLRLVDAQERERSRIARELHDSLGQGLTAIVTHIHAALRGEAGQSERSLQRGLEMAQQAVQQVKSMSFQLRPAQLELLGFTAALQATIDRQLEASGVNGCLRVRGVDMQRSAPGHAVALRILQEALTNVLRHAGAHTVLVRLRFVPGGNHFVLTVGDDGRGFNTNAVLSGGLTEKNIGLHGMLERAELLGGRLRFRSASGRGTVVRLRL